MRRLLLVLVLVWTPSSASAAPYRPIGALDNGVVRLRLRRGARIDATVVVRGTLRSGYGLRIKGRRAFFVTLRDKRAARIGGFEFLHGIRARRFVEVLIFVGDDQLVAALYDRRLKNSLAILSLGGVSRARGKVGLLLGPDDRGTRLLRFSLQRRGRRSSLRFAEPSRRLYVTMPRQVAAKAANLGKIVEQSGTDAVLETRIGRLETLLSRRLPIRAINAHRPWKYVHQGYKTPALVAARLRALQQRYPRTTRLENIARSHLGRPVSALCVASRIKPKDTRPSVLLNGGHHGTEPLSVEFVLDAITQLLEQRTDKRFARILDEVVICAVPVVNPDGLFSYRERSLRSGRKNGRDHNRDGIVDFHEGVDLNRNYPFRWTARTIRRDTTSPYSKYHRGPSAASEPEVRGMMRLAARENFVASISYHTGSVAIHSPYTIAGARSPQPNIAAQIAAEIVRRIGKHPEVRRPLRLIHRIPSVAGTDQDYYLHAHGTIALLIEGARRTPRQRRQRAAIVAAMRRSWIGLIDRVLSGPAVWGFVRDRRGRPLQATVHVTEIKLREGERWKSRARDGRFDRLLPQAGRYHLRVEVSGYRPIEQTVSVGRRQRKRLEIVLRR